MHARIIFHDSWTCLGDLAMALIKLTIMWRFWGMRLTQILLGRLSRPAQYYLSTVIADLVFRFWSQKGRATSTNAAQVLGLQAKDQRSQALARRCFRNYAKYLLEFFQLSTVTSADLLNKVNAMAGYEHIEEALDQGRGLILVTGHFGNWDIAGAFLATRHPVSVIVEVFQPPELNALVQGSRAAHGMKVIPLENAARQALRVLNRNEILGLLIDRPVHDQENGVPVRLFGRETQWPGGAAALAMKTGALVIAGGCWRNPDDTYSGLLGRPIQCYRTGDYPGDLKRNMQLIVNSLEEIIRPNPDQWYMFRRMWPETKQREMIFPSR